MWVWVVLSLGRLPPLFVDVANNPDISFTVWHESSLGKIG
jgi:hypothetical protein